jgi:hypothetical protein
MKDVPVDQRRDCITWTAPGGGVLVRLLSAAIDRLNAEAMRGYGVTRRRGTEAGGVLLGRLKESAAGRIIIIESIEAVSCEYAFGPSYVLSPADEARFRYTAEKWRTGKAELHTVGYFRSHTRDNLHVDEVDADLFSKFFDAERHVALIIKPFATRTSRASFFIPVSGKLDPSAQADDFPFAVDRSAAESAVESPPPPAPAPALPPLVEQPPGVQNASAPAPAPFAPIEITPEPAQVRHIDSKDRILADVLGTPAPRIETRGPGYTDDRLLFSEYGRPSVGNRIWRAFVWTAFIVAVFACGGVAGYRYAGMLAASVAQPVNAATVQPPADPFAIDLTVERQDDTLVVRWNRDAAAVEKATNGALLVTEQRASKEVKLGYTELRSGTVIYQNVAPEVTFNLELFLRDNRRVVETVTWRMPEGERPAPAKPARGAGR